MPMRAVIFDMGGVLLRSETESGRRKWEARLGLQEGELARIVFGSAVSARASVGKASESDVWKHVAETFALDNAQLHELITDFWSGDWIDQTLVQFIRDLRPRYKTGILSNAWLGARAVITQEFGLGSTVDIIVISAEEGVQKPDARIYRIAAERLGVSPEEVVFVDDMAENVEAARAIGMRGIQFKNTAQVIAEVKKYLEG